MRQRAEKLYASAPFSRAAGAHGSAELKNS